MSRPLILSVAALSAALLAAQTASASQRTDFLDKAIQGDNSEIMLGKLAQQHGATAGVRNFGRTLVEDHTKARRQAVALDRSLGGTPPAQPMSKAQDEYNKLKGMSGPAFDREFVSYMASDHQQDISDFQNEASGHHGKVGRLAQKSLPVLHKHLSIAQRLSRRG